MKRWRCNLVMSAALISLTDLALAQPDPVPKPQVPDPKTTIPEKIAPPEEGIPGRGPPPSTPAKPPESLSEKLSRTEGVIRPPTGIDPELKVPAPVPDPGTTRVIPPPGSPGNPSPERPK